MRKVWLGAIIFLLSAGLMGSVIYAAAPSGDLTIIQIKMTGSETLVLENTSNNVINLSNYQLEYFNKSQPSTFVSPTSSQQLPTFNLPVHQSILISGDSAQTCGATVVTGESFTMSDTAGYVMVAKATNQSDGSLLITPQDHVSWTSSSTGADLVKVPSNTADPNAVWYRKLSDGSWQQAELGSDCSGLSVLITPASTTSFVQWSDGAEAPANIISLGSSDSGGAFIPSSDIGLASPQVTEVLPNPASPQTDAEDEFIEIYNPNDAEFDLSGFKLQVGTTTKHTYIVPAGSTIGARSFRAFFSIDTNLAMSNSNGQVSLLDPLGTILSSTEPYSTAKKGLSWALANGKWYWTNSPTPNAANIINQGSSSTKSTKSSTGASVKGASINSLATSGGSLTQTAPAPVHPWTIAAVGSAALLYAGYEYRTDLANNVYRLRRYYQARRDIGK